MVRVNIFETKVSLQAGADINNLVIDKDSISIKKMLTASTGIR